jgi:hypothetical protein
MINRDEKHINDNRPTFDVSGNAPQKAEFKKYVPPG